MIEKKIEKIREIIVHSCYRAVDSYVKDRTQYNVNGVLEILLEDYEGVVSQVIGVHGKNYLYLHTENHKEVKELLYKYVAWNYNVGREWDFNEVQQRLRYICPVCKSNNTGRQKDLPALFECLDCGSEWNDSGEIIFNAGHQPS